jgi:hypothetical protein
MMITEVIGIKSWRNSRLLSFKNQETVSPRNGVKLKNFFVKTLYDNITSITYGPYLKHI